MRRISIIAVAVLLGSATGTTASVAAEPAMKSTPDCNRACLYGFLDKYLAGLKARDARKVPWAAHVKNTENNVELRVGDGLWGTITALDAYEMRFADPQTGTVAIFGVVQETTERSPYATRLKVVDGAIAEAETIVVRPSDAGIPFVTADIKPLPVWDEILTPALRSPPASRRIARCELDSRHDRGWPTDRSPRQARSRAVHGEARARQGVRRVPRSRRAYAGRS